MSEKMAVIYRQHRKMYSPFGGACAIVTIGPAGAGFSNVLKQFQAREAVLRLHTLHSRSTV